MSKPLNFKALRKYDSFDVEIKDPSGAADPLHGKVCRLTPQGFICVVAPGAANGLMAGDRVDTTFSSTLSSEPIAAEVVQVAKAVDSASVQASGIELRVLGDEAPPLKGMCWLGRALVATVVLVGFDRGEVSWMEGCLGSGVNVLAVEHAEEALHLIAADQVAVVCLGSGIGGAEARDLVEEALRRFPFTGTRYIIAAAGPDLGEFQGLVDSDKLFFLAHHMAVGFDLLELVASAVERWRAPWLGDLPLAELGDRTVSVASSVMDAARRVAMQDELQSAGELASEALLDLVEADRSYYLIYDREREELWSGTEGSLSERRESSVVGLVSVVARTGRALRRERIREDPNYDRSADDPQASGGERFLAVPVCDRYGQALVVLVAVKEECRKPFSSEDVEVATMLASLLCSSFKLLALQQQLDRGSSRREQALPADSPFREEAMRHHARGLHATGDPLHLSPRWTRWAYPFVLVSLLAAMLFSIFGSFRQYASGPAILEMASAPAGRRRGASDRTVEDGSSPSVPTIVAFLPARYGKQLRRGLPLRVHLHDASMTIRNLPISWVGDRVLSPEEARGLLGPEPPDDLVMSGSVVVVKAALPLRRLDAGDRSLLHGGLTASADVLIGSERVLFSLFPQLRGAREPADGR